MTSLIQIYHLNIGLQWHVLGSDIGIITQFRSTTWTQSMGKGITFYRSPIGFLNSVLGVAGGHSQSCEDNIREQNSAIGELAKRVNKPPLHPAPPRANIHKDAWII